MGEKEKGEMSYTDNPIPDVMELDEVPGVNAHLWELHQLKGIRQVSLRRFAVLHLMLTYDRKNGLHQAVAKRCAEQKIPASNLNLAWAITVEDIMAALHCSKRTAYDYQKALRAVY